MQVEGCGLDLSSLRHFFRKQRICGNAHPKRPLRPRPCAARSLAASQPALSPSPQRLPSPALRDRLQSSMRAPMW
jgi:hypothetical protein